MRYSEKKLKSLLTSGSSYISERYTFYTIDPKSGKRDFTYKKFYITLNIHSGNLDVEYDDSVFYMDFRDLKIVIFFEVKKGQEKYTLSDINPEKIQGIMLDHYDHPDDGWVMTVD